MAEPRIAIIGAGIAGAASAYYLASRGANRVILLDKERQPGTHSTGRNAAILRTAISDPALHAMARESAAFYMNPPEGFSGPPLLNRTGLYLAATADAEEKLRSWITRDDCSMGGHEVAATEIHQKVPDLSSGLACAWSFPAEGVFDVHAILQGFLRGARAGGVDMRLGCSVNGIRAHEGRVQGLETHEGFLPVDAVLVATGGWAKVTPGDKKLELPLIPYRRHLLVTAPDPTLNSHGPAVWIGGDDFYFRPESGGMLMSACDTVPVKPEEGELSDSSVLETLGQKTRRWLPRLAESGAAHFWAGMRTFAPDERFVVGPDPRLEGLHWAAGLGGHGITCGAAVGDLAASWLYDSLPNHHYSEAFLPQRLLQAKASSPL